MKQTTRALRALSPKRSLRHPRTFASGDDDSDSGPSPTAAVGGSPTHSLTGRISSRGRHRPRRRRSSAAAAELPELEKSEEDFKRDWGISRGREEILLIEFRKQLEVAVSGALKPVFDRFYLRRFLRARQHDLARAKAMFLAHLKWRDENGIDTILQDFHFQERDAFLSLYPQGYHKTDKAGRPVYIQHLGAIKIKQLAEVTTEDRMIRFHVQEYERCLRYIFPSCSKKAGRHIDQTFAIMDVKGVGLKHLTGDVKSILTRITETDQNNYPETLGKTVIINAPTVFKMIWAMVRPMLDVRTQGKIEVAPSDYMKLLLRHIDAENIPDYLGGKSKGSLIDDVGPWKDPTILALVDAGKAHDDIARRERTATSTQEELDGEGGVLSGDSMDLEGSSRTPIAAPSPMQLRQQELAATTVQQQQQQASSTVPPMAMATTSQQSTVYPSPFGTHGGGALVPHSSGQTDSKLDEFQDAYSRRQSILSTSGSSAYLSAGEDDSDFFTPKHSDLPQVGASGFSFRSDHPLLTAGSSAAASPEGKLQLPAAALPPPSQQPPQGRAAGQQGADARGFKYSDQSSSPEWHQQRGEVAKDGTIQAARRAQQQRPPTLVIPAANSTGEPGREGHESSRGGGPGLSLNGDITGTPGSMAQQWSPSKGQTLPSPPMQIPILGAPPNNLPPPAYVRIPPRVRALEEKLPEAERPVRRYLPPGDELPSKAVGQGTLLHRVEALERAMDTLLRAQDTALDQQRQRPSVSSEQAGCSSCCCIM